MPKPLSKRAIKQRIRKLLAAEIRALAHTPDSVWDDEPPEVSAMWRETVEDIAEKIFPEDMAVQP